MASFEKMIRFKDMQNIIKGIKSFDLERIWWQPNLNDIDYIVRISKYNDVSATKLHNRTDLIKYSIVSVVFSEEKTWENYQVTAINRVDE